MRLFVPGAAKNALNFWPERHDDACGAPRAQKTGAERPSVLVPPLPNAVQAAAALSRSLGLWTKQLPWVASLQYRSRQRATLSLNRAPVVPRRNDSLVFAKVDFGKVIGLGIR